VKDILIAFCFTPLLILIPWRIPELLCYIPRDHLNKLNKSIKPAASLRWKIFKNGIKYFLSDWIVFILSIFLIITLFRACATIKILRKFLCTKLVNEEDNLRFYSQARERNLLIKEILFQFCLLLRDLSVIILLLVVLALQQRVVELGKRFHAVYLIKKKKGESVLV